MHVPSQSQPRRFSQALVRTPTLWTQTSSATRRLYGVHNFCEFLRPSQSQARTRLWTQKSTATMYGVHDFCEVHRLSQSRVRTRLWTQTSSATRRLYGVQNFGELLQDLRFVACGNHTWLRTSRQLTEASPIPRRTAEALTILTSSSKSRPHGGSLPAASKAEEAFSAEVSQGGTRVDT